MFLQTFCQACTNCNEIALNFPSNVKCHWHLTAHFVYSRIVLQMIQYSYLPFLGVGKIFRLLMQSCCFFFFSRPFHENFKFLKNCPYDFHEIFHSHYTPKGASACAKPSKSYGWDVRNIAKISPKMAKKQPFFDFFRFSQKLSIRFERNFLQLLYTILESYMCNGIKIVWLGCEKHSQN